MPEDLMHLLDQFRGKENPMIEAFGWPAIIVAVVLSLFISMLVARLYTAFYQRRATGSQIHRAFPLLGVAITAIFISVQFSLPLSLGLLGALSIVRFRTPIKEPEEIGFLMLLIACAIGCATFNLLFVAVVLIVAVAGLMWKRRYTRVFDSHAGSGSIVVDLPAGDDQARRREVVALVGEQVPGAQLTAISDLEQSSCVTWSIARLDPTAVDELEGRIKGLAPGARVNIVFNHGPVIT